MTAKIPAEAACSRRTETDAAICVLTAVERQPHTPYTSASTSQRKQKSNKAREKLIGWKK